MRYEDPAAPAVAFVAGLSAVALILVIIFLQSFFYFSAQREAERKALVVAPGELARLHDAQLAQLAGYRVVDRAKGVVTIPIEPAMAEVVRENASSR
jgi:hypothetical protein